MPPTDPFSRIDRLDDDLLDAVAARLEKRGENPAFVEMLVDYLDALGLDEAESVLDVGCGTGVAARAIAARADFSGRVTGIDLSPRLVAVGKRLAEEERVGDRVDLRAGDTRDLDFPDESFDAVVAHTLVSHVAEPRTVLAEAARVLKPGGGIGIFDGDYASLTFGQADSAKAKADDEALVEAVVTNPRVMREMPRILREVGLELETTFSFVLDEIGGADYWLSGIEVYERLMVQAGVKDADEAREWADGLRKDAERGVFFGASNFYAYVATKP